MMSAATIVPHASPNDDLSTLLRQLPLADLVELLQLVAGRLDLHGLLSNEDRRQIADLVAREEPMMSDPELLAVFEIFIWDKPGSLPARWRQYPDGQIRQATAAARQYFDEEKPYQVEIRRNVYDGVKLVGSDVWWLKPNFDDDDLEEDNDLPPAAEH